MIRELTFRARNPFVRANPGEYYTINTKSTIFFRQLYYIHVSCRIAQRPLYLQVQLFYTQLRMADKLHPQQDPEVRGNTKG